MKTIEVNYTDEGVLGFIVGSHVAHNYRKLTSIEDDGHYSLDWESTKINVDPTTNKVSFLVTLKIKSV